MSTTQRKLEMPFISPDSMFMKNKGLSAVSEAQIVLDTDGIYILDYGVNPWLKFVTLQFGLIGSGIYHYYANKKIKKAKALFEQQTPAEIVAASTKSIFYTYSAIEKFMQKKGMFGSWEGQPAIHIWVGGKENRLYFPKDIIDDVRTLLSSHLPGKEVTK